MIGREIKRISAPLAVLGLLAILPVVSGCQDNVLGNVTYAISPNLSTVTVALNFAQSFQSDMGGTFDVANGSTDYGQVVVQPTTSATPFSVGFAFNTAILNDPAYNKLLQTDPSVSLPAGQPLPIPNLNRALAQLALKNQISPDFDPYVYLDVAGLQWVGVALSLTIMNNKYLPSGLAVQQGFLPGKDTNNRAWAAVYGPQVDSSGNMTVAGGIAIFVDVKGLINGLKQGLITPTGRFNNGKLRVFYY